MANHADIIRKSIEKIDFDAIALQLRDEEEWSEPAITAVYDAEDEIVNIELGLGHGIWHQFDALPTAAEIRDVFENIAEVELEDEAA